MRVHAVAQWQGAGWSNAETRLPTGCAELASLAEERITDVRLFLEQLVLEAFQSFAEPRQQQLFRIMMSDGIRLARDGRINLFERLGDRRERMEVIMRRLIREGWLRAADPQVLAMSFAAPLFAGRLASRLVGQVDPAQDDRAAAVERAWSALTKITDLTP